MAAFATTAAILVAMSGWAVALVGPGSWARLAWTVGLAAYLIHLGFAFGFLIVNGAVVLADGFARLYSVTLIVAIACLRPGVRRWCL